MRSSRKRSSAFGLGPFLITVVAGIPVAVLLAWPQAFGAQTLPVLSHVLSFRAALAIALGATAVVAAAVALLARRRSVAAGVAIVLAASSVANAAVLLSRSAPAEVPEGDLTVVAWNTQGGAASPESIARLVLETGADIVSLPETDEVAASEAVRLLALQGMQMASHTTRGEDGDSWLPTSLLIAAPLGEYRVDTSAGSTPGLPSALWRPIDGDGPPLVAAHPMPPLPGAIGEWRDGLGWVADRCDSADVIVAGDLNATVDHLSAWGRRGALIGDCRDAAAEAGGGSVGTWPATVPAWLASPIDHVLFGSAWSARGSAVLTSFDDAGSDHRPVVAVLDRP